MTTDRRKTADELYAEAKTPREQAMVIAQDVLDIMKTPRMDLRNAGEYLFIEDLTEEEEAIVGGVVDSDMQLNELLKGKRCTVCAKGGIFLAAVDRFDRLKVQDTRFCGTDEIREQSMMDYMGQWFTRTELDRMEMIFEGWNITGYDTRQFYERLGLRDDSLKSHEYSERKMAAMMQSILDNGGYFDVAKLPGVTLKEVADGDEDEED